MTTDGHDIKLGVAKAMVRFWRAMVRRQPGKAEYFMYLAAYMLEVKSLETNEHENLHGIHD